MKILDVLKKVAVEFCTETSLHGVQFSVEPRRALIERCFWRLVIFVAFIASVLGFRSIIHHQSQSQVVNSLVATSYPSLALQQPAVTICSSSKIFQSSVDRFFNVMTFDNEEEKDLLKQTLPTFLHYLYNRPLESSTYDVDILMRWYDYLQQINWSPSQFMFFLTPECSEIIMKCTIGGTVYNCSDIFKLSRTGVGFCCSYGYIQTADKMSIQNDVKTPKGKVSNTGIYGFEDGIALLLNLSSERAVYTTYYNDSAVVFIHSPKEFPTISTIKTHVSGGTETFIRFKSTGMMTSPGFEDLSPLIRQCYMEDEVKLKYFDHYTLNNCIMESDMESFISRCNCLLTNSPNQGVYNDCTIINELCVDLQMSQMLKDVVKYISIDGRRVQCLKKCTYVRYTSSVTFGDFDAPEFNAFMLWDEVNVTGLTVLQLFQRSTGARVFKRSVSRDHWEILGARIQ